jgi:methylated-DNA-[protein]-cysteine S-methyltransferase
MSEKRYCSYYESPVGGLQLVSDGENLLEINFPGHETEDKEVEERSEFFGEVVAQLDEYFAGRRKTFDLPIRLIGTPFQVRAWEALRQIPYGETISYKEQAQRVGTHARAVGLANGRNPIPIVVPCHRVIGADGSLVGFGGGLDTKRILLNLEAGSSELL